MRLLFIGTGEAYARTTAILQRDGATIVSVSERDDALRALTQSSPDAIVVGPAYQDSASGLLQQIREQFPQVKSANVVVGCSEDLSLFQDLVNADALFYVSQDVVGESEFLLLVRAALDHQQFVDASEDAVSQLADADSLRTVLDYALRLVLQPDLKSGAALMSEAVSVVLGAHRVFVLRYDPKKQIHWNAEEESATSENSAAAGLCSFVARTGTPVTVANVGNDHRYDHDSDDPDGEGNERLLAVPMAVDQEDSAGMLVAIRHHNQPEFTPRDQQLLEMMAGQFAPGFGQLVFRLRVEDDLVDRSSKMRAKTAWFFREEALEHYSTQRITSDQLELPQGWLRWSHWLLLITLFGAGTYSFFGRVNEYATGTATIHFEGYSDITSDVAGNVVRIAVSPGESVQAGQLLIQLDDEQANATLERVNQDFDEQLVRWLRTPHDDDVRNRLAALRAEVRKAELELLGRRILARKAGVVSGVFAREGQGLGAGDKVLTLEGKNSRRTVVALLPGRFRPQIQTGMSLRVELLGYRYNHLRFEIDDVTDEVVSRREAQRFLGPQLEDAVADEPVVIARANIVNTTFRARGREFEFFDGMRGEAEVRVRSRRIISLVPGFDALFGELP